MTALAPWQKAGVPQEQYLQDLLAKVKRTRQGLAGNGFKGLSGIQALEAIGDVVTLAAWVKTQSDARCMLALAYQARAHQRMKSG